MNQPQDAVSLDAAFSLPEIVDPDDSHRLRSLYEVIVYRLRKESKHIAMNTVQELLLERIAYNYILIRWKEIKDSFQGTGAARDYNQFWLAMTKEFNSIVKSSPHDAREALLREARDAIASGLAEIEDSSLRDAVRTKVVRALQKAGM